MKNLSTHEVQMKSAWGDQQIAGMPMMIFLGLATCVLYAGWNGSLPLGMVGALALMFVLGTLLSELGERIPPIREYLGGGTILAIFGGAALFEYRILPAEAGEVITRFMKEGGFLNFFIVDVDVARKFNERLIQFFVIFTKSTQYLIIEISNIVLIEIPVRFLACIHGQHRSRLRWWRPCATFR